jgi:hypothetical protein
MPAYEDYKAMEAKLPRPLPPDGRYRDAVFWAAIYVDRNRPDDFGPLFWMVDRCFGVEREEFLLDIENVKLFRSMFR